MQLPRLNFSQSLSELIVNMAHLGHGQLFANLVLELGDEGYQIDLEPGEYDHNQVTTNSTGTKMILIEKLGDDLFNDMIAEEITKSPLHTKMVDHLIDYLLDNRLFLKIVNTRDHM